jgi:glycosyltransferase involved in cell wall biosynthesis
MSKRRIAFCLSHPIQYRVPLLRRLAAHPSIDLYVFFYSNTGLVQRPHRYHGFTAQWDVPLLEGYSYEFLPNLLPKGLPGYYFSPRLVRQLMQNQWDGIIITSYLYINDWLSWVVSRWRRIPVLFYGEMYPRPKQPFLRYLVRKLMAGIMLRGCTACLAIGSVAAEVFKSYGVPPERIFLAPYAVDNDFFIAETSYWRMRKTELKEKLGIPPDLPVVLCVAGFVPKKRQIDLVKAMMALKIPAQLVLVGHGPLLDEVRAFCQQYLPDTILTGFKNQTELPKYYAIADVFVLPSLWEEFGLVINEAMCAGLPIIASNTTAASRDLVRIGENGYTFAPGDVNALRACLELLLADPTLRERFGQCSLEIISGWNYDKAVQAIINALDFARQKG